MSRNKREGYYSCKYNGKHTRSVNRGYALRKCRLNAWRRLTKVLAGYKKGEITLCYAARGGGEFETEHAAEVIASKLFK